MVSFLWKNFLMGGGWCFALKRVHVKKLNSILLSSHSLGHHKIGLLEGPLPDISQKRWKED